MKWVHPTIRDEPFLTPTISTTNRQDYKVIISNPIPLIDPSKEHYRTTGAVDTERSDWSARPTATTPKLVHFLKKDKSDSQVLRLWILQKDPKLITTSCKRWDLTRGQSKRDYHFTSSSWAPKIWIWEPGSSSSNTKVHHLEWNLLQSYSPSLNLRPERKATDPKPDFGDCCVNTSTGSPINKSVEHNHQLALKLTPVSGYWDSTIWFPKTSLLRLTTSWDVKAFHMLSSRTDGTKRLLSPIPEGESKLETRWYKGSPLLSDATP